MRQVKRVGVVGAGVMGRGIAYQSVIKGFEVLLYDARSSAVEDAVEQIARLMERERQKGRVDEQTARSGLENLKTAGDLAEFGECDFVIEAVTEDLAVKHDVFRRLDAVCPVDVVLATNTSAKSITEIAAAASRPERVVGMHFFNPVHRMELVEVVRGLESADWAVAATEELGRRLGKETIRVNERPGFATSRISALVGNEAFYMLMEGVASAEDIDKAIKLGLNYPMGPFELGDLVGWDTRLHVLEYLHETLGEKFRPCPLLVQYVRAGRLGRKVGRGVYEYDEQGRRIDKSRSC
ncbi:MAG: 3-hydroxyacyl-CoA dehydrogenase NAD-binding domain-containing protein [Alicyclobacillaceae bacterium]|nr:3-hydroxyacyl-CoA dehydrogenase NAD-binding domain-containing protein [Alicyclobacillaceae bacterium]